MSWDVEHWSSVDEVGIHSLLFFRRKSIKRSTGHNIYDLANDFKPEEAMKVELS